MSENISDVDCLTLLGLHSPGFSDFNDTDTPESEEVQGRFIQVIDEVINPTACIVGFVGNLMNVVLLVGSAWQRKATSGDFTSVFGLTVLSLVDITCCLVLLVASLIPQSVVFTPRSKLLMRLSMYKAYAVNATTRSSNWMTVLLATTRYAVICHPLRTRHLISVRIIGVAIFSVILLSYVSELPALWTYSIVEVDCSTALEKGLVGGLSDDDGFAPETLIDSTPSRQKITRGLSYMAKSSSKTRSTPIEALKNVLNDTGREADTNFNIHDLFQDGLIKSNISIKNESWNQSLKDSLPSDITSFYLLFSGPFLTNDLLKTGSIIAWFIFGFFGPLCALIFCNFRLVMALRHSRLMAKMYRQNTSTRCSVENRLTFTFVCIISVYVFFVSPSELVTFTLHFVDLSHQRTAAPILTATNCLQTFNYTFNFVMYSFPNVIFKSTCAKDFPRQSLSSRETPLSKIQNSAVGRMQRKNQGRLLLNDSTVEMISMERMTKERDVSRNQIKQGSREIIDLPPEEK